MISCMLQKSTNREKDAVVRIELLLNTIIAKKALKIFYSIFLNTYICQRDRNRDKNRQILYAQNLIRSWFTLGNMSRRVHMVVF